MDALRAKRAAQHSALKQVNQRLREAEARAVMPAHRPPSPVARPRFPVTLVCAEMVYHLAGGDRRAAEEFFALSRRNKAPSTSTLAPALLDEWAARAPEAVAACFAGGVAADVQRRRAEKFLAERGLRDWVMQQNLSKACAPRAGSVLREAARRGLAEPPDGHDSRRSVLRQWVRRWATRFRLLRGRFQPGARLTPAESAQKARQHTQGWQKTRPGMHFVAPILGPPRGPEIGATRHAGTEVGAARRPRNRGLVLHPRARQGCGVVEVGEPVARRVPARAPGHPPQHGRDFPPLVSAAGKGIPGATCHYVPRGIPQPATGGTARATASGDVVSRRDIRHRRCAGITATARHCQQTNRWQTRDRGAARAIPGHPSAALAPQVCMGRRDTVGPVGEDAGGRSRARGTR